MSMFDMAGRGGSGGGVDLSSMPLLVANIGGAMFTRTTDPDSIMDTAVTANNVTTWTYNAISSGSDDYDFDGGNLRPYRRDGLLKTDDGTAIQGGDAAVIILEIDNRNSNFSGQSATQTFWGIATDPTNTSQSSAQLVGISEEHLAGGSSPRYKVIAGNGASGISMNSSITRARAVFMLLNNTITDITYAVTGTGSDQGPQERNPGFSVSDGTSLYWMFGAGTRGNATVTAGHTAKGIYRYRVIKISDA